MTSAVPQAPLSFSGLRQGDLIAGKYRLEGVIGEGGMGVVLYAVHLDLDRPVAIKVVRADVTEREEVIARMLLEARNAANIRSEHVARVLDVGRLDGGSPYIVMEYLEGCDLCTLLEHHGRLATDIATDFIIQACEALAEAHSLGIVHRDLKPENLFLSTSADGEPIIKVLDFGISKHIGPVPRRSMTNPANAVGSPHYMAPEQMRAAHNIDARVDIWALGAILFELVTGRPPFDAETLPAVCAQVVSDDPPHASHLMDNLPAGVDAAIWRCLRKDPTERFASVAELASALAPYGSASSALSAERVSRISATTYRRSIMRLPMPSRPDVSPLPSLLPQSPYASSFPSLMPGREGSLPSLLPLSVTATGKTRPMTTTPRHAVQLELRQTAPRRSSKKKLAWAGAAIGACGAFALTALFWGPPKAVSASEGFAAAPPPKVEVPAQLPEAPRTAAGRELERELTARDHEANMPQKSVDELPAEATTQPSGASAAATHIASAASSTSSSASGGASRARRLSRAKAAARTPGATGATATSETATSVAAATPPSAAAQATAVPDAWNPERFGGRR